DDPAKINLVVVDGVETRRENQQCDGCRCQQPVDRDDPANAPEHEASLCTRLVEIVLVDIQHDEAGDDEEQIDPGVPDGELTSAAGKNRVRPCLEDGEPGPGDGVGEYH